MSAINCVSAEYDSASQDLSSVASELQGAQIDDFSETVQFAMPDTQSVRAAASAECRFKSLLVTHSKALYELSNAAKAAGVSLQLTEQQNTQAVVANESTVVSGSRTCNTAQVLTVA